MPQTSRADYRKKMEGQLKRWNTRLKAVQTRAEKAGAGTKKDLLAKVAELKRLETSGKRHLASIGTAATSTWNRVKSDLTDKWNHASGTFDAIWARPLPVAKTTRRKQLPATRIS